MSVRVEFFGMARQRVERESMDVDADSLRDVLQTVSLACPGFQFCLIDGTLSRHYIANVNLEKFTRDNDTPLTDGDSVLILSADAGG